MQCRHASRPWHITTGGGNGVCFDESFIRVSDAAAFAMSGDIRPFSVNDDGDADDADDADDASDDTIICAKAFSIAAISFAFSAASFASSDGAGSDGVESDLDFSRLMTVSKMLLLKSKAYSA